MSAAAVAAVRPGLRIALRRARPPATPAIRCPGLPSADASARDEPRRDQRHGDEQQQRAGREQGQPALRVDARGRTGRARARPARARRRCAAKSGARRPIRDGGISAPSRMALTGATRVARSAGPRPASSVTTIPTASDTMIVRVESTVAVVGSSMPSDANTLDSSFARPRPATRPISDATVPISERLGHDRAQHLPAGGAEGPQQRELTRALRDRDRERVVDRERAHEHGDPAEARAGTP